MSMQPENDWTIRECGARTCSRKAQPEVVCMYVHLHMQVSTVNPLPALMHLNVLSTIGKTPLIKLNRCDSSAHRHTHTHIITHDHTHIRTHTHTHTHVQSRTHHTHANTRTRTHTRAHAHALSLSLTHTHTHALTITPKYCQDLL